MGFFLFFYLLGAVVATLVGGALVAFQFPVGSRPRWKPALWLSVCFIGALLWPLLVIPLVVDTLIRLLQPKRGIHAARYGRLSVVGDPENQNFRKRCLTKDNQQGKVLNLPVREVVHEPTKIPGRPAARSHGGVPAQRTPQNAYIATHRG